MLLLLSPARPLFYSNAFVLAYACFRLPVESGTRVRQKAERERENERVRRKRVRKLFYCLRALNAEFHFISNILRERNQFAHSNNKSFLCFLLPPLGQSSPSRSLAQCRFYIMKASRPRGIHTELSWLRKVRGNMGRSEIKLLLLVDTNRCSPYPIVLQQNDRNALRVVHLA